MNIDKHMILDSYGPKEGPVDMTIYRQRSPSHSSQQSCGGSTSGDSASGESATTFYNNTPTMNGHSGHYYVNGFGSSSRTETMLNGYHTPPPYPHHQGRGGYHPLGTNLDSDDTENPIPVPPRRYSPIKSNIHHGSNVSPSRQQHNGIRHQNGGHHRPLDRARSVDTCLSPLNGAVANNHDSYSPQRHHHISGRDLSQSYDTSMAKILQLHRNLAKSYSAPQTQSEPKLGIQNCYSDTLHHELQDNLRDEPPLIPARKNRHVDHGRPVLNGGGYQNTHVVRRNKMDSDIDSCHSNSTSTPNSSTPSTPTSEAAAHGVPNGYATIRGKPPKFNLHTISENLGQLFSRQGGSKQQSDSLDGESLSPTHSSTPLKTSRRRSNSIGNFLGLGSLMGTSTEDELDSDDNNDDYGFLSPLYTSHHSSVNDSPSSPAAMHKAKSPTPAHRILPKKWRKSKLLTPGGAVKTTSLWKPKVGHLLSQLFVLK